MKSLRTKALADLLGVTPNTVRHYVEEGRIPHHKTPKGQLFFTEEDLQAILPQPSKPEERWAYYTRSSSGRKTSLENQKDLLTQAFPAPVKVTSDNASGLNEKRKGLKKLMEDASQGLFTDLAVTTPDRLSRFGNSYLEAYFQKCGVTVHYLSMGRDKTSDDELWDDFMALLASFSGRFYKMRGTENQKKLLARAQEELEE